MLKITPKSAVPPNGARPYSVSPEAINDPQVGLAPSSAELVKVCRTLYVSVARLYSKMTPSSSVPPSNVIPKSASLMSNSEPSGSPPSDLLSPKECRIVWVLVATLYWKMTPFSLVPPSSVRPYRSPFARISEPYGVSPSELPPVNE